MQNDEVEAEEYDSEEGDKIAVEDSEMTEGVDCVSSGKMERVVVVGVECEDPIEAEKESMEILFFEGGEKEGSIPAAARARVSAVGLPEDIQIVFAGWGVSGQRNGDSGR